MENFILTAKVPNTNYIQSVCIHTITKKHITLIQTDKAIYKPSDNVSFRILVLNSETKPYHLRKIDVKIADSRGNVVYEGADLKKEFTGVFTGNLEISDSPPLGKWKIDVTVDKGDITTQFFEVSEYVLPRFRAIIDCPPNVLLSDKKIKVAVFGKYTFGDFVEATATLTVTVYDAEKPKISKAQKIKITKVSAKKNIEFEFLRDLKLNTSGLLQIDLAIEEKATGKTANDTRIVAVLEREKHIVQLITSKSKIKPGFPFPIRVLVKTFDGLAKIKGDDKVRLKFIFYQSRPQTAERLSQQRIDTIGNDVKIEKTSEVELKNGMADFVLEVPKTALGLYTVTAHYLDAEASVNLSGFLSQSKEYLRAEIVMER